MATGNGNGWGVSPDELKPALELALTLEHTRTGMLMLLDESSGELRPAVYEGLSEEQCVAFGRLHTHDGPLAALAIGRNAVAPNGRRRRPNEIADFAHTLGAGHLELFPLQHDGHTFGALALVQRGRRRPTWREARMVERCAKLVATALDVGRLRERAEQRREHAEAAAASRVQLLAQSSHELRTPLQSITGYVELLRLGVPEKPTHEQERMLERIEVSEKLLLTIIDDLIAFARIEAGRVEYELRPVALNELAREVETIIAPLAQRRDVRLVIDPIPAGLKVMADATKLEQIFINLLGNAVRILPANGTVRLGAMLDRDEVRIDVADDGPGIEPAKLETVFEPFVQLAGGPEVRGSGLGLTIARELAIRMGATLSVQSEVGRGAVFTLRINRA